jgi:hypothetical protein
MLLAARVVYHLQFVNVATTSLLEKSEYDPIPPRRVTNALAVTVPNPREMRGAFHKPGSNIELTPPCFCQRPEVRMRHCARTNPGTVEQYRSSS